MPLQLPSCPGEAQRERNLLSVTGFGCAAKYAIVFCIASTCVRVHALASPHPISLYHPISISPPATRTLAHSLKISFSLVFRLFGIRFGFSSVDFMNLTLFGCGSLCRRQATGDAECLRRERGAWLVAKVAASTWQTAADGLKVAVCVTLPGKYS